LAAVARAAVTSAEAAGALDSMPLEAAAVDGVTDAGALDAPPPVQADATIAKIANGATTRSNGFLLVKSGSPLVVMNTSPTDNARCAGPGAIQLLQWRSRRS
jgi:hypothetical protein